MIARACQLGEKPTLIDATAGLGHDSLLMAHLGANVRLIERHPILFVLLEYAKVQAERDPFTSHYAAHSTYTCRLKLLFK